MLVGWCMKGRVIYWDISLGSVFAAEELERMRAFAIPFSGFLSPPAPENLLFSMA